MLNCIDDLLKTASKSAPLEDYVAKKYRDSFIVDYCYNSVAMDDSTLSKSDTERILFEEESLKDKTLNEHVDVHAEMLGYLKIEYLLSQGEGVGMFAIKELHRKLDKESAGEFRKDNMSMTGALNQLPSPEKIERLLKEAIEEFEFSLSGVHFVHRLAYFHLNFEMVHPFSSKNGSVGRHLVNLALMKAGYPPIVFLVEDKLRYYDAFNKYFLSGGDGSEMCKLFEEYIVTSLKRYVDEPRRDKFVIIGRQY